jgi:acetyl-CoA C-acetyltransferase
MSRYHATPESFMHVGLKNHDNGALNDKAQFGSTIRQVMEAKIVKAKAKGYPVPTWSDEMDFLHDERANPMIAWPMRLFDCSPISDGAAALLLVSEEIARRFTDEPVYIIGSGQASDVALHDRADVTTLTAARVAAQQSYQMADISPKDIKLAEVHDCFTIAEVIATEDLGFFEAGEGYIAAEEGLTRRNGPKPVNTSGGLKSKGHPVGASGAGQVVEIWKQMHNQAGKRQVSDDVDLALSHNVGGTGQTCVVHIFERR